MTIDEAVSLEGMGNNRDMVWPVTYFVSEENDREEEILVGVRGVVLCKDAVFQGFGRAKYFICEILWKSLG